MKPLVVITQRMHFEPVELLHAVCDVAFADLQSEYGRHTFSGMMRHADGLIVASPAHVAERSIERCLRLRIVACTYRIPEHIDVAACTRRGIWVTNVTSRWLGKEAELEAARNVLDAISGDVPRCALNDVLAHVA